MIRKHERNRCARPKRIKKHNNKTGGAFLQFFPCNEATLCKGCAARIGEGYQAWILNAINSGKTVWRLDMSNQQYKSFKRKVKKPHYRSWKTGPDTVMVIHDVAKVGGSLFTIYDCLAFDWPQLAYDKAAHAKTTPNKRANASGKLGHADKKPDGKLPFRDVAICVEDHAEEKARGLIEQASQKTFQELGPAQTVADAEKHASRFGDLVDILLIKAGLSATDYTILRVRSRGVYVHVDSHVSTTGEANAKNDNDIHERMAELMESRQTAPA